MAAQPAPPLQTIGKAWGHMLSICRIVCGKEGKRAMPDSKGHKGLLKPGNMVELLTTKPSDKDNRRNFRCLSTAVIFFYVKLNNHINVNCRTVLHPK